MVTALVMAVSSLGFVLGCILTRDAGEGEGEDSGGDVDEYLEHTTDSSMAKTRG